MAASAPKRVHSSSLSSNRLSFCLFSKLFAKHSLPLCPAWAGFWNVYWYATSILNFGAVEGNCMCGHMSSDRYHKEKDSVLCPPEMGSEITRLSSSWEQLERAQDMCGWAVGQEPAPGPH